MSNEEKILFLKYDYDPLNLPLSELQKCGYVLAWLQYFGFSLENVSFSHAADWIWRYT